jgi:metal-responsive CopG/Arc/MetJ family transcriptional regulator
MRTIVELPERAIEALDRLGAERKVSRAALVREAVDRYLEVEAAAGRHAAYGAWDADEDGLEIQRRLRGEWEER